MTTTYVNDSDTVRFAHYTAGATRALVVGRTARENLSDSVVHQDSGDFRPHFLLWAVERWNRSHPGHDLRLTFDFNRLSDTEFEAWFNQTAAQPTGLDNFACMWPSMSSQKVIISKVETYDMRRDLYSITYRDDDGPEITLTGEVNFLGVTSRQGRTQAILNAVQSSVGPATGTRRLVAVEFVGHQWTNWGWGALDEVLNLDFRPGNKGFKRRNEICRLSRIWYAGKVSVHVFGADAYDEAGITAHMLDGCSIISQSFAIRCARNIWNAIERRRTIRDIRSGKISRLTTFRLLMSDAMIKGDAIIVPDAVIRRLWGHVPDVITGDENLKDELVLKGSDMFCTWDPKKPEGEVHHDFQTKSWMNRFLDNIQDCVTNLTLNLNSALIDVRDGELPTQWTQFQESHYLRGRQTIDSHGEPRPPHASEVLAKTWLRISAAGRPSGDNPGFDIRGLATVTSLVFRGIILAMESRLQVPKATPQDPNPDPLKDSKMWAPAPWSMRGYVVSREILEVLGGRTDLAGDHDTLIFDQKSGSVVIPGTLWQLYSDLHGGGDYDDGLCIMYRIVPEEGHEFYSEAGMETLRRFIPDLEPGETIGVCYRQPNTKGEYFVMRIDHESFKWFNTLGNVPTLDLNWCPEPRSDWVNPGEETPSAWPDPQFVWSPTYQPRDAIEAIEVAFRNPGVGAFMNALMIAYDMGIEPELGGITAEEVVDICQAKPYREAFEFLDSIVQMVKSQILEAAAAGQKLDLLLWAVKVADRDKPAFTTKHGFFYMMWKHACNELGRFRKDSRTIGFELRARYAIPGLREMEFQQGVIEIADAAISFYLGHEAKIQQTAAYNRANNIDGESPYREMSGLMAKKIMSGIYDRIERGELTGDGRPWVYMVVLCMYQRILLPREPNAPYGIGDNMLCGPPPERQVGMLDLFLEALAWAGIGRQVGVIKSGLYADPTLYDRFWRENVQDWSDQEWFQRNITVLDDEGNEVKIDVTAPHTNQTDVLHLYLRDSGDHVQTFEDLLSAWTASVDDVEGEEAARLLAIFGRDETKGQEDPEE